MPRASKFTYDVFLSHHEDDAAKAGELAERLRNDGLQVRLPSDVASKKRLTTQSMRRGLKASRSLVLLTSRHGTGARLPALEEQVLAFSQESAGGRRLIPVRLDATPPPEVLRRFAAIDWRRRSKAAYASLLEACRPAREEEPRQGRPMGILGGTLLEGPRRGHVRAVAVAPDGKRAVAAWEDGQIFVWDVASRSLLTTLKAAGPALTRAAHSRSVYALAISPDGRRVYSGGGEGVIRVWDVDSGRCTVTLAGHRHAVRALAVTPDGTRAVSGSWDGTSRLWDLRSNTELAILDSVRKPEDMPEGPGPIPAADFRKFMQQGMIFSVAMTADGTRAVTGDHAGMIRVWDLEKRLCIASFKGQPRALSVAIGSDGQRVISGSTDRTVRVWSEPSSGCDATLEGHEASVASVAMTHDGRVAVSASADRTLRVWDLVAFTCIAVLHGHKDQVTAVAMTPDGRRAVSVGWDSTVRVWDVPRPHPSAAPVVVESRYTNAKVIVTGESGVGKTGLAKRLVDDRFEPTESTVGVWATQFVLPEASPAPKGVEREVWLWDFAGQSDFRLIHQLYMNDTALALLVFNPQAENSLAGLAQWERDITRAADGKTFRKLLVAARCDAGGLRDDDPVIRDFVTKHDCSGFFATSAKTGRQCAELRTAIAGTIDWEKLPLTVSPRVFKRMKEQILAMKDAGRTLLRMDELSQSLALALPGESFGRTQLETVVALLAGSGVVWRLEFGDYVLLQPEWVSTYAAALVNTIRQQPDGLGSIPMADVLAGKFGDAGMPRLAPDDERVVLTAMHETLLRRGLCYRHTADDKALLVFPAYYRRVRPADRPAQPPLVRYRFTGSVDEVYTTLVVRLYYAPTTRKATLWRDAAEFTLADRGLLADISLQRLVDSVGEITVHFDPDIPDEDKAVFVRYVDDHLRAEGRTTDVVRTRLYVCATCKWPVKDLDAVRFRLDGGHTDTICARCNSRVLLFDTIEGMFASPAVRDQSRSWSDQADIKIDNESRGRILVGEVTTVVSRAGQIFRETPHSDWGIDGEIEFKDRKHRATSVKVLVQLKSGDSHLSPPRKDGAEFFTPEPRHVGYWTAGSDDVFLVVRTSDERIRWMNISKYLKRKLLAREAVKRIEFQAESFDARAVLALRDRLVPALPE